MKRNETYVLICLKLNFFHKCKESIPGFLKNVSLLLNIFGKFLFGYVLSVVNVIVVMAVSSLEKGLINRNIGKEILKTF